MGLSSAEVRPQNENWTKNANFQRSEAEKDLIFMENGWEKKKDRWENTLGAEKRASEGEWPGN